MLKKIVGRLVRKHRMLGLLIMNGDIAVKNTKTKKDDEVWAKVKELLETF